MMLGSQENSVKVVANSHPEKLSQAVFVSLGQKYSGSSASLEAQLPEYWVRRSASDFSGG